MLMLAMPALAGRWLVCPTMPYRPDDELVLMTRAMRWRPALACPRQYIAAWRIGAKVPRRWTRISDDAVQAGRRTGVDDARHALAASLGLPAPVHRGVAHRGKGAAQMDADHRIEVCDVHVDERLVAQDAGVVDQHIERTERGDRGLDQPPCALPVGHVVGVGNGLAAQGADLRPHLLPPPPPPHTL